MTTWRLAFFGWLASALVSCASADPPKYPDWPTLPVVPQPMPTVKVEPATIGVLPTGKLYVVQHSGDPVQLLASPEGVVSIVELPSNTTINGEFVDGKGGRETRTYSGKQVWLVERVHAGNVELLKVPKGTVERRLLIDDQNPIPPPKPVDPTPAVEKSPWDNAPGLRVLIVYPKHGALPASQQAIVTGKRVRDYLDAKTAQEPEGKAYWILKTDEDVTGLTPGWQKAYATTKGDRWVVIANGAKWTAQALPENPDKMLELLRRYE